MRSKSPSKLPTHGSISLVQHFSNWVASNYPKVCVRESKPEFLRTKPPSKPPPMVWSTWFKLSCFKRLFWIWSQSDLFYESYTSLPLIHFYGMYFFAAGNLKTKSFSSLAPRSYNEHYNNSYVFFRNAKSPIRMYWYLMYTFICRRMYTIWIFQQLIWKT